MYYIDLKSDNHKNNEKPDYVIDLNQHDNASINNRKISWDIVKISEKYFHLILDNHCFKCEVVEFDSLSKHFTFNINGKIIKADLKDERDLLLKKLGITANHEQLVNRIVAPMPGLILAVKVTAGQQVQKGAQLVVLNAMKMENIIKSPVDGVIKKVLIEEGQNVEKNQLLIQF